MLEIEMDSEEDVGQGEINQKLLLHWKSIKNDDTSRLLEHNCRS